MSKTSTYKSDNPNKQILESCTKNYKPWVWTLILMAILTLGWVTFENYQEGGIVKALVESDDYKVAAQKKMANIYNTGGLPTPARNMQETYHDIIEKVRPSIVSIDAATGDPQMGADVPEVNYTRIGSGVIVDPEGFVLSSLHIVLGATALKATVYGPQGAMNYPLKVVNVDKNADLALFRILGTGPFPYAILGDSDQTRTGDVVLAMGSPFGFDNTITSGIISSRNRTLNIGGRIYEGILQTDTPINKGNSGGPLVNLQGEVIGINTAIYSPTGAFSGIGFAIPANKASSLMAGVVDFKNSVTQVAAGQLANWARMGRQVGNAFKFPNGQMLVAPHDLRGRCCDCHPQLQNPAGLQPGTLQPQQGTVQQVAAVVGTGNLEPFIGATFLDVDPVIAKQFNLLHSGGVLVDRVYQGTPAENAGLQRGDIIMRADGKRMKNVEALRQYLGTKKIGEEFALLLLREGARKTVKIRTVEMPPFMPQPMVKQVKEFEWLGSEISPLPSAIEPFVKTGVYVTDADGVLKAAGVIKGDVIKGVNYKSVTDMISFMNIAETLNVRDGFLLDIIRAGHPMYITVRG